MRRLSQSDVEAAVEMYHAGNSLVQIGQQVGVTAQSVWRQLHNRGIQMRPKGGQAYWKALEALASLWAGTHALYGGAHSPDCYSEACEPARRLLAQAGLLPAGKAGRKGEGNGAHTGTLDS